MPCLGIHQCSLKVDLIFEMQEKTFPPANHYAMFWVFKTKYNLPCSDQPINVPCPGCLKLSITYLVLTNQSMCHALDV